MKKRQTDAARHPGRVLPLGVAFILLLQGGEALGQFGGPTRLGMVSARKGTVPSTIVLVGTIEPFKRSLVASEIGGIVESLPVEEGDLLEPGKTLCTLRPRTHQLAVQQAKAMLGRLSEELRELENGSRPEEIEQAKAMLAEAEAMQEKWENELARLKRLGQGLTAEKELNDARAEAAAARQRVARANAVLELAVEGPRSEQIARARLAVEEQRLVVERLQYDLEQTQIRMPFTGYVTAKHTEVGQWVAAGGPVVEVLDLEHVLVRVDVPESAIAASNPGVSATVVVEAVGKTYVGEIAHVIPQADARARTFPVEVKLGNEDHALKSGMFVRAILPSGPAEEMVIVPRDATIQRGSGHYVVMVVPPPQPMPPDGGDMMAIPVPVRLGASLGAWVAVESAQLQPGVPVAVKGHDRVFAPQAVFGQPIEVSEPEGLLNATPQPAGGAAPAGAGEPVAALQPE